VNRGNLEILNGNLDTGNQTRLSEYVLCDRTYPELLKRLANAHFRDLTPGVRTDMLASLRAGRLMTPSILVTGKKVKAELERLKSLPAAAGGQPGSRMQAR